MKTFFNVKESSGQFEIKNVELLENNKMIVRFLKLNAYFIF